MDEVRYDTPSHHDAEALLAFFSDLQSELPHLHVYPDDELTSVDRLEGYIRRMNHVSNSHILVARHHDRIIGCVTVEGGRDTAGDGVHDSRGLTLPVVSSTLINAQKANVLLKVQP